MLHICENFWNVTTMNIDPQNSKSDQIFGHKYLVRPCQSDPGQYPEKSGPSQSFNYLKKHMYYQDTIREQNNYIVTKYVDKLNNH